MRPATRPSHLTSASLLFQAGPFAGQRYALGDGDTIIGRRSDCQIFVPDPRVSRQHARIHLENDLWAIEDLGSNNGTYVNGQRIQSVVLADNDEIVIADNRIRVALPLGRQPSARSMRDFDGVVTVLDLENPSIVVSSESASASGVSRREASGVDDLRDVRLLERRMDALCAILDITSQVTEPRQVLESLCGALLDVFPPADEVGVLVADEQTGELKAVSHRVRHDATPGELRVPGTIIQHVVRDRRGVLIQDRPPVPSAMVGLVDDEPRGSRMGAPIQAYGTHYGLIYVESWQFALRQEDVDLLTSVAAQAGQAIHATRMQQQVVHKQRLERDLRLARQIQRSLLPPTPPDVIGLDFAAHYDPAYEIGGDFYDFIWHDKQNLALVVGDVAGKAISAALYMARLTSELRSRGGLARTPSRLLRQVNEELLQLGDDSMFATLIYAIYDLSSRTLAFTNAGHVVPLLRRDGRVYPLQSDVAHVAPLGVVPQLEIGEARVQLHSGDLLVLTTDGIHEARDANGNEYGLKRLSRRIRTARGNAQDVLKAILQDVDSHVGTASQGDDMTIVAMGIGTTRARARTETHPEGVPLSNIDPGGSVDDTGPLPVIPAPTPRPTR